MDHNCGYITIIKLKKNDSSVNVLSKTKIDRSSLSPLNGKVVLENANLVFEKLQILKITIEPNYLGIFTARGRASITGPPK